MEKPFAPVVVALNQECWCRRHRPFSVPLLLLSLLLLLFRPRAFQLFPTPFSSPWFWYFSDWMHHIDRSPLCSVSKRATDALETRYSKPQSPPQPPLPPSLLQILYSKDSLKEQPWHGEYASLYHTFMPSVLSFRGTCWQKVFADRNWCTFQLSTDWLRYHAVIANIYAM